MKFLHVTAVAISLAIMALVGHVSDATTGQPLTNVTIAIGSHKATTDAHGNYRIQGLTPGHYTLSASSNDVPPQQREVVVKPHGTQMRLNLILCSTTLDYSCAGPGSGPAD